MSILIGSLVEAWPRYGDFDLIVTTAFCRANIGEDGRMLTENVVGKTISCMEWKLVEPTSIPGQRVFHAVANINALRPCIRHVQGF